MIETGGGLSITLKPRDVTWFNFLGYSRATNSKNGGWNFKGQKDSYWRMRALEILANSASNATKIWTLNSLSDDEKMENPRKRTGDFMLARGESLQRLELEREWTAKPLCKWSENALNFALYIGKIPAPGVQFLGYEVPLCQDSEKQLKVDVLGYSSSPASMEIFELKKSENRGDSPLMALVEAICYAIQLHRCGDSILKAAKEAAPDIKNEHFSKMKITLAAPQEYWEYWKPKGTDMEDIMKQMRQIVQQVNRGFSQQGRSIEVFLARAEITENGLDIK
jgi:hypothetical protein